MKPNGHAINLRAQGRYEEADARYALALEIDREALPEDHPYIAAMFQNLETLKAAAAPPD